MRQLGSFLERIWGRIDEALGAPDFSRDQVELLRAAVAQYRQHVHANPLDEPISLLYLITQAWERPLDEQVERVAAFCSLYLFAADLLDDVQDDDLAGKSHELVSPAVATNNAVSLLFLALRELHEAVALEACAERRVGLLRLVDRISLVAVSGQHRDLTRGRDAHTRAQVLEMQMAKTAGVSLVVECGALLSGCGADVLEAYRTLGQQLAGVVQLRDDLRDVFGKRQSPDLRDGKLTYPMACLLERADDQERAELHQLMRNLPESSEELRKLVYDSGVLMDTALAIEDCRRQVHVQVARTGNAHAAHRTLLDVIDAVAGSVYTPPELPVTRHLWVPSGRWHQSVRQEYRRLAERLRAFDIPALPTLRPWHAPQWMYAADRRAICYPDMEQQSAEVLPFNAELLGIDEPRQVAAVMVDQCACVLAHEVFHFWRHVSGRMTIDYWHEEWVANQLAVAYLARYEPDRLGRTLLHAEGVVARFAHLLDGRAQATLSRCHAFTAGAHGYGMPAQQTAVVGFEMLRRLASEPTSLDAAVRALLVSEGRGEAA